MEEIDGRPQFFDSFDLNHNESEDPLFKTPSQTYNQAIQGSKMPNKKPGNLKLTDQMDKSASPFAKKQVKNQLTSNENAKNSPYKGKAPAMATQAKNKTFQKPSYSTTGNPKLNSEKKNNDKLGSFKALPKKDVTKKLKAEED